MLSVLLPRNVPVLARGRYPSHYYDAPGAYDVTFPSHPTYEDTCLQAPLPPWPRPGLPEEYDTYQASEQPQSRSNSEHVQGFSTRSANKSYPKYPLGFVRKQSSDSGPSGSRTMTATWSPPQGPAGVQDSLEKSYFQVPVYSTSIVFLCASL